MNNTFQKLRIFIENQQYTEANELLESLVYFSELKYVDNLKKAIQEKNKKLALFYLNELIASNNKPESSENIDIVGLQTTYQLLKTQMLVLTNQKIEAEKLISQFRIRYYRELGFIISDILKERLKLFEHLKDTNPDNKFEYQKTQDQYQKFFNQWEHVPKESKGNIDEETKQKLTFYYRKASKLCHPDLVDDSLIEEASKIFVKLNKAYIENDLSTVEQILNQLENGLLESEETVINHKKKLSTKLNQLKQEISILKKEIEDIKNSPTYSFIVKLDNLDNYFEETREKLLKELTEIRNYANVHSNS